MAFILPTDEELRAELEKRATDYLDAAATLKDSSWAFQFSQSAEADPADVHGI